MKEEENDEKCGRQVVQGFKCLVEEIPRRFDISLHSGQ